MVVDRSAHRIGPVLVLPSFGSVAAAGGPPAARGVDTFRPVSSQTNPPPIGIGDPDPEYKFEQEL